MKPRAAVPSLFVLFGAAVLASSYLATALRHTGPYGSLPEVRLPVAASLFGAYVVALGVGGALFLRAASLKRSSTRWLLLALWAVGASLLLFFAPALPYLVLAGACKAEALCPEAANPIAWALSGLATSREKPFASTWAVLALALAALLWEHHLAPPRNEA
jgi:hypothetical protein